MAELRLDNSIVDDRYLVERCLGRGSYAEIFLAFDQSGENAPVIIKALNAWLQGTPDPDLERTLVENFENEAIALDQVRHPNIIRRLGHGTAADLETVLFHYILLEYMPGGDLLEVCRKRRFAVSDALFYFQQVAEALAFAHSRQVIHRDIKPNNLLLSADHLTIKVADFGVAKMAVGDDTEITRVGTNVYAPPEHHPDSTTESLNEKLTPSADIYSLAKTIYTTLTGSAPRQFARRPIDELPADLMSEAWGGELLRILARATASRPCDRYGSAQEFWEDFARLDAYVCDDQESDPEATIVRSRLSGTSSAEQAAAMPHFQTLAGATYRKAPAQKARIVVDLPQRPPQPLYIPPADQTSTVETAARPGDGPVEARDRHATAAQGETQVLTSEKGIVTVGTKKGVANEDMEQSFFDDVRAIVGSEWLRRVFVIFLVAALVGLVASTYFYFADNGPILPSIFNTGPSRDGAVANAPRVNMRSEPRVSDNVLAELPEGTRVRVLENQSGWVRIKVLRWAGDAPSNGPDSGWIDGRYVRLD
ncbi:MAG: serine/threonine protein kinase [Blastocatellia bacterium]|nr:serine/threonine protein kinase [Blastocatellia bacterium]